MLAVEFQATIIDGRIEIPQAVRERFSGSRLQMRFSSA
jgi:hypothetical protein